MSTHHLTAQNQGKYHYTVGPYARPVLRVRPGGTVAIETLDAFEGKIESEATNPSSVLKVFFSQTRKSAIYVDGAAKGDALAARIEPIMPRGPQPRGTTCLIPNFGGLCGTDLTAMLHEPLPEIVREVDVTEAGIRWNDRITLPYEPYLGTVGTSPDIDFIDALTAGKHGGNMDLPDICPGATLYLSVKVEGAHLYLADDHATQGDGESVRSRDRVRHNHDN